MENQTKKFRLEEIKVESFVTESINNPDTIHGGGGSVYGDCNWTTGCSAGQWCSDHTICNVNQCRGGDGLPTLGDKYGCR